MTFAELKVAPELIKLLLSHDISNPTEIQSKTFPSAANGHDIIGIAETGSGKTLAFILPLLQQILISDKPFHSLILAPTRELADQIFENFKIFESLKIRIALLKGGEDFNSQVNAINKKPHIIIGTPGRIAKHIEKTKNFYVSRIRKLVFDEADKFCDLEFEKTLDLLSKNLIKKNQTLMFTATLTDKTKKLAGIFMRSPRIYGDNAITKPLKTIKESFALIPEKYKLVCLYNYLKSNSNQSTIIFVNLCSTSQKIGETFGRLGLSCRCLHGKISQKMREETIKSFRIGEFNILVSTDLASRGLDIPHVELVINFDLPDCSKIYTHRIGRTARAGKDGLAIQFVTQYDIERLQKLEFVLQRRFENINLKNYANNETVTEAYEEINVEFNSNKKFKR